MLSKFLKWIVIILVLVVVVGSATAYIWFQGQRKPFTEEGIAADLALQDESAITVPKPIATRLSDGAEQPNPNRNLYFGELHLHTTESFDSALFGNRLTIEDAYRFARGEKILNEGGEAMQLSRPLDFVAITDHAEFFGTRRHCNDPDLKLSTKINCWVTTTPNMATFKIIRSRADGDGGANTRENFPYCNVVGLEQCLADAAADWQDYMKLADDHNVPGEFTVLKAYEYSPTLPDRGKYHRNVFFRGDKLPDFAISMLDAPTAIDLWQQLAEVCSGDECEFFTVPHNMNRAWGLPYGEETRLGDVYSQEDWALRAKYEPLAEIFQIKGASECARGAFATDEECDFEQVFQVCEEGQETGCAFANGFAREGLKVGLLKGEETGLNPLEFGFIAATDSHNSNPGDTEEWDYSGSAGSLTAPAVRRQKHRREGESRHQSPLAGQNPGGLAAVWAPENTRDSLFGAMQSKETYGTSGTRIQLRFFAGWGLDQSLLSDPNPIPRAYFDGVPMGGELTLSEGQAPGFFIWAMGDAMSAPLQRIQIVKGWVENGEAREKVMDVACSDGLSPDEATGRCPDNGASVDLATCLVSSDSGAMELQTVWHDPEFDSAQAAFYYVRVLQNPTCRWSTFDALRLGREPTPHAPATVQERAWSSPIWYKPEGNT